MKSQAAFVALTFASSLCLSACVVGTPLPHDGGPSGGEGEGASAGEGEGAHGGEGEGANVGEGEGAHAGEGEGANVGEGEGQAGEGEGEGSACTPQCSGKQCGDDGCGSTCAPGCSGSDVCNAVTGVCAATCTPATCGANQCGTPPDGCGTGGTLNCGDPCSSTQTCDTTTFQCVCAPQCLNKQCGDDGCGGSCGTCSGGAQCDASTSQCVVPAVSYASQVATILVPSCGIGGCHAGAHPQQGLNLSSASTAYTALVNKASKECASGTLLVKPGSVAQSYIVDKILGSNMCSGTQMPGGGNAALPQADIDTIEAWIANGALNN